MTEPTAQIPSPANDSQPRRRRIVPAAHLRLADPLPPVTVPGREKKKGDVAAFIRAMPTAAPDEVVVAAKAMGIETTAAYVRWRRWADRGASAQAVAVAADAAPAGAAPQAPVPTNYVRWQPKAKRPVVAAVPVLSSTAFAEGEASAIDAPVPARTPSKVRKSAPSATFRSKAVGPDAAFRAVIADLIVSHGLAHVRALLDELEADLLAAGNAG